MTMPSPSAPPGPFDVLGLTRAGDEHAAGRWPSRWRRILRWDASSAPVALLLAAGFGIGPQGIHLVSAGALASLEPAVPVALAALGVLVGVGVKDRRRGSARVIAAATLESALTMTLVASGVGLLIALGMATTATPVWAFAALCGVCAATSLTLPRGSPLEPLSPGARAAELGVLLPVVAGGMVLAYLRTGNGADAGLLLAQACGVTLALAGAAWLLLLRTASETEERVFALAALLLIGGIADALSLSALLGGLVAGVFWRLAGRQPRDTISRDVLFVQHPLVMVVLLMAGARTVHSSESLMLAGVYLLLRVAGKVAGGALAVRVIGPDAPRGLVLRLLSPGVFGVALALNALNSTGADGIVLLSAVVAGTIATELVGLALPPRRADE